MKTRLNLKLLLGTVAAMSLAALAEPSASSSRQGGFSNNPYASEIR